MGALQETGAIIGHNEEMPLDKPIHIMTDREQAKRMTLMQMTKRVDENAFRIVDFAAVYIESREAHVRAINDLVLSMGPYLTALKAYSVALKSYADAAEEKATHILNMRDLARIEETVNDARAIVAFNDPKGGSSGSKPHPWFSDDDKKGQGYYAAAYFKQREQEKYDGRLARGHRDGPLPDARQQAAVRQDGPVLRVRALLHPLPARALDDEARARERRRHHGRPGGARLRDQQGQVPRLHSDRAEAHAGIPQGSERRAGHARGPVMRGRSVWWWRAPHCALMSALPMPVRDDA